MKKIARNLIKLFCINLMLIYLLGTEVSYAQNNLLVLDSAYIVLSGGTATNAIYMVVDQTSSQGIVRLSGGHIHSENQYHFVKWLTGTNIGTYVFPFGIGGNAADYIPFTFNKTAGNSSITISTWSTNAQNLPKPAATNVGPVTNMAGITDSVVYAIDRFWDIQATSSSADLTFSYRGIENTTSSPTFSVQAQHWNGTSWDAPAGPGTLGVTSGIGTAGPFIGQNTFSPWVLITTSCPADTVTQNPFICQGDSVVIGINVYTVSGTYIDTLVNTLGCDSIVTTHLTVNPIPVVNVSASPASICAGENSALTASGAYTYNWSTSGTGSSISVSPSSTSTYTVTGTDGNGCSNTSSVTVNVLPSPQITLNAINEACDSANGNISALVQSIYPPFTYLWSNGMQDTAIYNLTAGTYSVTISDNNGCSSTESVTLINDETNCEHYVYVPNLFSPNGDGNNDVLAVISKGVETLHFSIYNRWGNKVFETTNIQEGWNGEYKGMAQNSAVFIYILTGTFLNGEPFEFTGDVSLIR